MYKITIVGENCLDVFIYGTIERLCPEAPVPVFKPEKKITNKGMIGNIEENIKSMFNDFTIITYTQKSQIIKTRIVEEKSNHMVVRIDEGEEKTIDNLNIDDNFIENLKSSDIVIVSDYDKGFLSINDIKKIGENSKLSILDTKKKLDNETIRKFTFIKLNEKEYMNNLQLESFENIIITLGSKGAQFQNNLYPSNSPKETIDVSGAGDTFVTAFIINFFKTRDVYGSIKFANKMSSIVVTKRGVSTP
jgi:D-beta-D-heptose 7-phosphate kinase/D-beta-D-heptose 1-phosphate adenosyltransferase